MIRILFVVYDNDSYIHFFPHGLGYLTAVMEKEGYEVEIYNQDQHHYAEEHLTDYLNRNRYDFIGVSVIAGYYQYRKLLRISDAINRSRQRPIYLLGGHGPSPEPEFFLRKTGADYIVVGEGEETTVELLDAIVNGRPLAGIMGIAYRGDAGLVVTPRRQLIKDVDSIPFPAYHKFPIEYYRLMRMPHVSNREFAMPLLSGRGCTFTCSFCYRMDEGFRPRSSESIIDEIRLLKSKYNISYISFTDELLMSTADRTVNLCEDFIRADLKIKWDCNGRLNFARPDVLRVMKKAGCTFINYGIEAMDDGVLRNMNKCLTVEQAKRGVEETLKEGMSPGLNIIFGNIGDTTETLSKGVEFLLKYSDISQMRTIRPVTPYPGSPLYYYAIENGLLRDAEDFYERKHLNSDLLAVNFTDLTDDEFHNALLEANSRLLRDYFQKRTEYYVEQTRNLYLNRDTSFRGYRQT